MSFRGLSVYFRGFFLHKTKKYPPGCFTLLITISFVCCFILVQNVPRVLPFYPGNHVPESQMTHSVTQVSWNCSAYKLMSQAWCCIFYNYTLASRLMGWGWVTETSGWLSGREWVPVWAPVTLCSTRWKDRRKEVLCRQLLSCHKWLDISQLLGGSLLWMRDACWPPLSWILEALLSTARP